MLAFKSEESDIYLSPVVAALVLKLVQHLSHVMVAVVYHNVMICSFEFLVCAYNRLVPLVSSVLLMIKYNVFEGRTESQFTIMHRPHADKVIDQAIRASDSSVSDAGEAAGDAGECSPNDAVGVSVIFWVYFHLYFEIHLHK